MCSECHLGFMQITRVAQSCHRVNKLNLFQDPIRLRITNKVHRKELFQVPKMSIRAMLQAFFNILFDPPKMIDFIFYQKTLTLASMCYTMLILDLCTRISLRTAYNTTLIKINEKCKFCNAQTLQQTLSAVDMILVTTYRNNFMAFAVFQTT